LRKKRKKRIMFEKEAKHRSLKKKEEIEEKEAEWVTSD